jgi:aconitate hydratase
MIHENLNSFQARSTLEVGGRKIGYFDLGAVERAGLGKISRLPFSMRILLENLLRNEDGRSVRKGDIEALARWDPARKPDREIAYMPARVLLQDFTGVPAIVDLAAMRDAMADMGDDPAKINPQLPVELVIDHSVQVDSFGRADSFRINVEKEYERNRERYAFLRWGQNAFRNFRAVPPGTGIVHQVNIEYLARVVFEAESDGEPVAYPDTLVGTDSHTTMVNGLGVLGWGVGGIEAEAAMLGQPITLLIPQVVGFRLHGSLREGATATDLVLTVTKMLRQKGVVGKFVEFFGPGITGLPLADRVTLANMAPEYGATCGIFPIDSETIEYLRLTAREPAHVELVEAYAKAQGMWHTPDSADPEFSDTLDLDLGTVEPSLAGPKRPQDQIRLEEAKSSFEAAIGKIRPGGNGATVPVTIEEPTPAEFDLRDGSVVIAAITSCTNTSNPSVMLAAGLVAKKAVERGLERKPWVKTSLAPGSKVVTEYLERSGLTPYLDRLGFQLVGYGCTTCIGNSGPLAETIAAAIRDHDLVACSVLSGNRNFEGRVNPHTRANYLASPPLVVAYALAGRMDIDLHTDPIGRDRDGNDVHLRDIWPTNREIRDAVRSSVSAEMFREKYSDVFHGDDLWRGLDVPEGDRYEWETDSTYVRRPTFFEDLAPRPEPLRDIEGARVLARLGDTVTTDHISPAGVIAQDSPAGRYLVEHGVSPADFNSYGSRRGNHEVMMRGTFANIRLRNELAPGTEGGWTRHLPDGEKVTIYDAAVRYAEEGVPLLVIAGKEYGTGSSRDWAAKGTFMLGIRAVIAESFERIHRSNLIGMGVLPLQFSEGEGREGLGLTGEESYEIRGIAEDLAPGKTLRVTATAPDGRKKSFEVTTRIDTPVELEYYRHGGILNFVLRSLR